MIGSLLLAALWGTAEATLFFIVPDVFISFVALRSGLRAALLASLAAALGAALGGILMYVWGESDPATAKAAVAALPAIDAAMVDRIAAGFADGGYLAMLRGSVSGVPYKIYAVLAGEEHRPLFGFVLATPLVRLPRFALTALVTAAVSKVIGARLSQRGRLTALSLFWTAFYGFYFAAMP